MPSAGAAGCQRLSEFSTAQALFFLPDHFSPHSCAIYLHPFPDSFVSKPVCYFSISFPCRGLIQGPLKYSHWLRRALKPSQCLCLFQAPLAASRPVPLSFCKVSFSLPFSLSSAIRHETSSPLHGPPESAKGSGSRGTVEREELGNGVGMAVHKPWLKVEPPFKRLDVFNFLLRWLSHVAIFLGFAMVLRKRNNYHPHRRCWGWSRLGKLKVRWCIRLMVKDGCFTNVLWKRTLLDNLHVIEI